MTSGRQKILDGARAHYEDVGASRFSMRGAAEESGVTAAALYYHFDDRSELLAEIVRVGFVRLLESLRTATDAETPGARLRETCRAYVRFAIEHPRDYEAMFLDEEIPARRVSESLARGERPTFQFLVGQVKECMRVGPLSRHDPLEASLLIWSTIHGLCSLHLAGRFDQEGSFRDIAEREIELLLGVLRR